MINQAVIFCGGFGKRLLPLTKKIPKPMVKLDNKPFLFHLIMQCKSNGINNFLILCGYKANVIKKYFGNGSKMGVKIKYHYNPPYVETYKRLIDAKKLLKEQFLLMYSDNYSDESEDERFMDPEHFGVLVPYSHGDLPASYKTILDRRAPGVDPHEIIPIGHSGLKQQLVH